VPANSRVFVVTGIARPDRLISDILGRLGCLRFHRVQGSPSVCARDIRRIAAEAKATGSMIILTTESDAVRLHATRRSADRVGPARGGRRAIRRQTWLLACIRNPQSAIRNPQSR
jgi:tetraacyldisaccharide-1-P 4'-kinase